MTYTFHPPPISFKIHIRQFLNKLIFNSIKPFELVTIIQNNMLSRVYGAVGDSTACALALYIV